FVPTGVKVELLGRFAALGFKRVEATSYSNPAVVPQFADATDVLKRLPRNRNGVSYKATCANVRAVERAAADLEAGYGANEISLLVSATDAHSRKNLNRSREEQWQNIADMVRVADGRFKLVGTISVAFGCPFEGKVERRTVREDAQRFLGLGVRYVTLGDTTRMATPSLVNHLITQLSRLR